jgi:hypothetical protein
MGTPEVSPDDIPFDYAPPPLTGDYDPTEPPDPSEIAPAVIDDPAAARFSPIAPQPVARESLRLVLHEGDDEDADQKCLSTVFRLLQEHPGIDDVFLTIKTRDGEDIELRMPTAALDEELKTQLAEAVGMIREVQPV